MLERVKGLICCLPITMAFLGLVGCSGAAGYTQTPEELTPRVDIIAGDNQNALVNTAFTTPMRVRFHKNGRPLGGHLMTFSAPESGVGGTFPDSTTNAMVITDGDGFAVAPAFTANGIKGKYPILAWSVSYNATFHLANE